MFLPVLLGFTNINMIYWVLLDFTGFYWAPIASRAWKMGLGWKVIRSEWISRAARTTIEMKRKVEKEMKPKMKKEKKRKKDKN